eukprot:tig00000737_g3798.t1
MSPFVVVRRFSSGHIPVSAESARTKPDGRTKPVAQRISIDEDRKRAVATEGRQTLQERRRKPVPVEGKAKSSLIDLPSPAMPRAGADQEELFSERDSIVLHGLGIDGEVRRVQNLIGPWKSPNAHPALVLNTDFRPLSYLPLSLWGWQDAVKATFLGRVTIVSEYDRVVRSPNFEMKIPSVVALKEYVRVNPTPAFTRYNVFLRDRFCCQYCAKRFRPAELSFDHVVPRCKGGKHSWDNVVASCHMCNARKGGRMPKDSGFVPLQTPYMPSIYELQEKGREYLPTRIHDSWRDYL